MRYLEIKNYDVSNGPGVRVSIFVSGCTHHCKGCFNESSWDFKAGKEFGEEDINNIIELMKPDYINGLSLLGGEPFEPVNQEGLLPLVKRVKEVYPNKNIWCYSGYLFDKQILDIMVPKYKYTSELLKYIDVLVDGEFHLDEKDLSIIFRGSSNQRIIDVQESLKEKKIVLNYRNDFRRGQDDKNKRI
ncbi:MAG TPA: anaerobic ribonucleoside-triphosphate reductase activating protein [Bacilli bacterium]|nr:anaerobic ribonucleoside-triphosphate reductase activating protein [Bacilli bacterium]HPZ23643.1 anaerobic ribonucleoside-triphosphate reductase activating protein [Bacilli bacterium]